MKANHLNDFNENDYICRPLDEFVYSFNSTQFDIMEIPSFIFSKAISKEMIRMSKLFYTRGKTLNTFIDKVSILEERIASLNSSSS